MTNAQFNQRITADPQVMVGKPVVKGTRLTVEFVLNLLARGSSIDDVLAEYDGLQREDVQACLAFAAQSISHASFLPLTTEPENV